MKIISLGKTNGAFRVKLKNERTWVPRSGGKDEGSESKAPKKKVHIIPLVKPPLKVYPPPIIYEKPTPKSTTPNPKHKKRPKDPFSFGFLGFRNERSKENALVALHGFYPTESKKQLCYRLYLQTQHWKDTRSEKLHITGKICEACASDREINVHHKNYDFLGFERMSDLATLCRKCHELVHYLQKTKIKHRNVKTINPKTGKIETRSQPSSFSISEVTDLLISRSHPSPLTS